MASTIQGNPPLLQYDIAAIRDLIVEAFTPDDLRRFCQKRELFREAGTYFGPNDSIQEMADELLSYCGKRAFFPDLLKEIQQERSRQFDAHGPYQYEVESKDPQLTFEELEKRARELLARRSFREAADLASDALSSFPNHPGAKRLYADAHFEYGTHLYVAGRNLEQAEWALEETLRLDPRHGDARRLLREIKVRIRLQEIRPESWMQMLTDVSPIEGWSDLLVYAYLQAHLLFTRPIWRRLGRVLSVAFVVVVLVAAGFWVWPKVGPIIFPPTPTPTPEPPAVHLVDAQVRFAITIGSSGIQEFPVGGTLVLDSGEGVLLEMRVTVHGEAFPRVLVYRYFSPRGSIPASHTGSRTSYVAPSEPGPDVISVTIQDQTTGQEIVRSINVVVEEHSP